MPSAPFIPHRKLVFLLFFAGLLSCSTKRASLFTALSPDATHVDFVNALKPSLDFNIIDYNYFYNGGGVGAGDFNNDGLTDLFFSGNQVSSRLYVNKGNLKFEDATAAAGLETTNWATGVAIGDINGDGLSDIYLSYAGSKEPQKRANQLFINKGVSKNKVPLFKDEATLYGVADTNYTTQSVLFDYNKDNRLDLLLINHYQDQINPNYPKPRTRNGLSSSNAKLYQNEGGHFTDVTIKAGIVDEGFGLGVAISDINGDGWPDIYISKDFVFDDVLYLNNQDGSFTESIRKVIQHASQFAMGCDIADFNNDLYPDIITVDMLPYENKRQKLMNIAMNNDRFNTILDLGYVPQYSRNMLQLNNGPDASGHYSFSEIGQFAGIYMTDWSWSPLFADLDNDGWKDLFITNGIPKDITNNDFITYRSELGISTNEDLVKHKAALLREIEKLETVDKSNFAYRNNKDLSFSDQTADWGLHRNDISTGAIYVDLDNDGDLDLVTNNINAPASVFRNNSDVLSQNKYLKVKLEGKFAVGAKVVIYHRGQKQMWEQSTCRGFQSSQDPIAHFGLGKDNLVDSVIINWLDGRKGIFRSVRANQLLIVDYETSILVPTISKALDSSEPLLSDISAEVGLPYQHTQLRFEDFNLEPLLPHRFSRNGPYLAKADVDGNGYEDFWVGGSAKKEGKLFLQQKEGKFAVKDMPDAGYEDMGGLFFDADGDGDKDLYVVSGGNAYQPYSAAYQDRLYLNDGKGNFTAKVGAVPPVYSSGSCVAADDFDKDGDLDLFVGGRVVPTRYGLPPESVLLVNDGRGSFQNSTAAVCPELEGIGMVTAALWTDINGDRWNDLVVVGEFMPVVFFKNENGILKRQSGGASVDAAIGWWFSIASHDFDKDGDIDFIVGNLGLNNKLKPSAVFPVSLYAKDFDGNGSFEPLLTYYLNGEEYTLASRDQIASVMPSIKKKFATYTTFSEASFGRFFSADEIEDAVVLKATTFATVYLQNKGNGAFEIRQLPVASQFAPVQAMVVDDFNGDAHADVLMTGNFYSPDFSIGRYDASIGLVLTGDGKGSFRPLSAAQSGVHTKGDTRSMVAINLKGHSSIISAANGDSLQFYRINKKSWLK